MDGARAGARQRFRGVGAGQQPGRAEQHPARVVRDLQRGSGGGHRGAGRSQQHGAARGAVGARDLVQLVGDHLTLPLRAVQDRLQVGDGVQQLLALGLQLDLGELGEPAQLHVEDVVGLRLGELEGLHQPGAGLRGVLGAADDGDHVVDVEDRDQQAVHQVQPIRGFAEPVGRAPPDDLQPVLQVDLQHLLQAERRRLAVHQRDRVDAEGVLQLGQPVQLLQQRLGVDAVLDLDHQPHAVGQVGQVLDVGDSGQLLGLHQVLDLLHDPLRADQVGQFGDHDALAARVHLLDAGGGAHLEAAAAGGVGVLDAVQADDLAAAGQVRPRDEPHQGFGVRGGVLQQVLAGLHHLDQVVRRDVGGHADRDAGGAVDQQVRDRGGQDDRLGLLAVVVGAEVDGVLAQPGRHRRRGRRHPALGVPHRCRPGVQRAKVAVAVHQGQPHRPRLAHPHQGVVDGGVAVRVQLAHHLADHPGALHVRGVGTDAHVVHRVEDAALDGLEAVAGVRQGAGVDHRVGVLQVAGLHLRGDVDVDDPLGDLVLGFRLHAPSPPAPRGGAT